MSSPHVCFADMPEYEDEPNRRHKKKNIENDENDASGGIDNSDNIGNEGKRNRRHSSKERSLSPSSISPTPTAAAIATTTTPRYERNLGFFQQLSRRFGLRSNDDLLHYSVEEDAHSSSTDSSSSSTPPRQTSTLTSRSSSNSTTNASKDVHGSSMEHISCASSETSSTIDIEDQQQQQQQLQLQQQQQQQQQQRQQKQSLTNGSKKAERKSITRSSFSRLHRRSTSSIRRAFENFSLSSRSLSCSGPTPPTPVTPVVHKNGNGGGNTTASNSNNSSYGGTPIKSALKSSSNTELNKRTAYFATSSHSFSVSPNSSSSNNGANVATAVVSKNKAKAPPQRILRQPVSYTYLKGISGLPTQRVPRNSVCCQYARR